MITNNDMVEDIKETPNIDPILMALGLESDSVQPGIEMIIWFNNGNDIFIFTLYQHYVADETLGEMRGMGR